MAFLNLMLYAISLILLLSLSGILSYRSSLLNHFCALNLVSSTGYL